MRFCVIGDAEVVCGNTFTGSDKCFVYDLIVRSFVCFLLQEEDTVEQWGIYVHRKMKCRLMISHRIRSTRVWTKFSVSQFGFQEKRLGDLQALTSMFV